jgi:hypothetical protein
LTPAERAFELTGGFRASQMVAAAAELRIPDLLAGGPKTADQLATATEIDRGRLGRFLRGLVVLGMLSQDESGAYSNTEVGQLFRTDTLGSRRPMAMMMLPHDYLSWGHFMDVLRSGATGQQLAHGVSLWDSVARDPDFAVRFNQAMASNSELVTEFVAGSGDFARASLIIDVGGGKGALVGGVLARHDHLRGVVCDLPAGLLDARAYLQELGVADRCAVVEADFFREIPSGGDVYLLKDILHDWDDEHAAAILAVCRGAMRRGAKLTVVERVMPETVSADPKYLGPVMTDLHMMVLLGGRERTLSDYRSLFEEAGFSFDRHVPGVPFSLVEAVAS